MLFSIIIINYKQKDFLLNCAASIKENLKCDYEIIVVNNSPESDYLPLEGVTVLNNSNRGFSNANNLAAKIAKGKYLLFLNADTILKKDFSDAFLNSFAGIDFAVAGISLRFPDGAYQLSYWLENNFFNEFKNKNAEKQFKNINNIKISESPQNDTLKQVDWVSGAAMVVSKLWFDKVNGFDEDYFLFYEDADLCKRISDCGGKIYYFPFDGLVHFKGEIVNKYFRSSTYFYSKQSQLIYYKKHNNLLNRILLRFYLFIKFFFKSVFIRDGVNFKILKIIVKGPYAESS